MSEPVLLLLLLLVCVSAQKVPHTSRSARASAAQHVMTTRTTCEFSWFFRLFQEIRKWGHIKESLAFYFSFFFSTTLLNYPEVVPRPHSKLGSSFKEKQAKLYLPVAVMPAIQLFHKENQICMIQLDLAVIGSNLFLKLARLQRQMCLIVLYIRQWLFSIILRALFYFPVWI